MNSKTPLHTVPVASTGFTTQPYWDGSGIAPAIRFGYEKNGVKYSAGIEFRRVLAMRTRAERCCRVWHIEAYDTLVEIEGSEWLAEICADISEQWRNKWEIHHYMIYLDSVGCFEALAESWAALPEIVAHKGHS